MTGLLDFLGARSERVVFALGVILSVAVGLADYVTGQQITFSVFYTIPIAMVSWFVGFRSGVFLSCLCVLEWLIGDLGEVVYAHAFVPYWNAAMRLIIFFLITLILSKLKTTLDLERRSREAAQQASRIKSEFLANMSHEIRTPMNSILAMADFLAEAPLDAEQRKYVHILKKEGDHLLRLINDILDLSKVEAGLFVFDRRTFDLGRVIEHVMSVMGVRAHEKKLALTCRLQPNVPPHFQGDAECLRRVILNLVGNAVKFTDRGEVCLTIENDPDRPAPGRVRFAVSDTGIGIPREKLDSIFERFTTVDSSISRKYGGTGLGLDISRKLVEGMGGRIWAESAPGKGSTFYFVLPLEITTGPIEIVAASGPEDADAASMAAAPPLRILAAEDYKNNQVILQRFLRDTPHSLDFVEDGAAAVEAFKSGRYDLVLMDVQMPRMDGYAATRAIREWELETKRARTPILALTAHALKEEAERSLKAGCDAHLTKPLTRDTLIRSIHEHARHVSMPAPDEKRAGPVSKPPLRIDPDVRDLIPDFLRDLRASCQKMDESLGRADYDALYAAGHSLRGCGGSYGFPLISSIGESIETAARNKSPDDIRSQVSELSAHLDEIEAACV
ncbi:response regulator [bacterium]|nr:response regulator [bacterium]